MDLRTASSSESVDKMQKRRRHEAEADDSLTQYDRDVGSHASCSAAASATATAAVPADARAQALDFAPPAHVPEHVASQVASLLVELEAGSLVCRDALLMLADLIVAAKVSPSERSHIRPVVVAGGELSCLGIERLLGIVS
jgi:hypothetical protein